MGNHKSRDRSRAHYNESQQPQHNHQLHNNRQEPPPKFSAIRDKYETYEQLQTALRAAGLESSNLIIGMHLFYSFLLLHHKKNYQLL